MRQDLLELQLPIYESRTEPDAFQDNINTSQDVAINTSPAAKIISNV